MYKEQLGQLQHKIAFAELLLIVELCRYLASVEHTTVQCGNGCRKFRIIANIFDNEMKK